MGSEMCIRDRSIPVDKYLSTAKTRGFEQFFRRFHGVFPQTSVAVAVGAWFSVVFGQFELARDIGNTLMAPFLVFSLVALTLEFFSHDSGDML